VFFLDYQRNQLERAGEKLTYADKQHNVQPNGRTAIIAVVLQSLLFRAPCLYPVVLSASCHNITPFSVPVYHTCIMPASQPDIFGRSAAISKIISLLEYFITIGKK
jgi:hypothetical protein